MNKICGLYARTSTGRQEKEETIDSQIAEIKERIKQDGNVLAENLVFIDDGWSGSILARPALDLLRDAVKRKEIEVIYIYDNGRLSRDFTNLLVLLREFEEAEIKLISLHDINPTNPEEGVMQKVMGVFHDYERTKIAERFRRGKLFKARNGNIVHGDAPYGYTYIYKTKDRDCHFVINQKEAEVVRKVYKWIAEECLTINKVIKRLYEQGITPRKGKRPAWTNGPLSRMVRNEAYIGTTYYNKGYAVLPKNPKNLNKYKRIKRSSRALRPKAEWIPIKIDPILDETLFYRVQKQLEINALYSRRNKKYDYLLSHLLWCECSSRMFGEGKNYYRCTDRLKNFPMPRKCRAGGLNVARIDIVVWEKIKELLSNPLLFRKEAEKWHYSESQQPSNRTILENERLQKALDELKNQESRYIKAYGEGLIPIELFRKNIDDLNKKRSLLQEQINKITVLVENTLKPSLPPLEILRLQLPLVLNYLSEQDKQFVLRKMVKEIIVNKERTSAKIRGHIPLSIQEAKENPKYGLESINRYCRFAQCRQVHTF